MTKATITRKEGYNCCPQGHTVEHFPFGEVVFGKVAEWAIADRAASRTMEKKPSPVVLETKKKPRGKSKK